MTRSRGAKGVSSSRPFISAAQRVMAASTVPQGAKKGSFKSGEDGVIPSLPEEEYWHCAPYLDSLDGFRSKALEFISISPVLRSLS
ncbi:hypothetical protein U1Q18_022230 [Sarracenia purpurea var. burkii]